MLVLHTLLWNLLAITSWHHNVLTDSIDYSAASKESHSVHCVPTQQCVISHLCLLMDIMYYIIASLCTS
jgi:hypothetical protein